MGEKKESDQFPAVPPPAGDSSCLEESESDVLLLGRIAREWELLRPEQLEEALREQEEARARGEKVNLGQLLVDRGWLKVEDLARLLKEQRQRIEGLPDIPRYEIRERIGEGATALVYRAWDRELNRPVALKVLKEFAGMSPVVRQRFHREAQAAAGLLHPNVVTVYDAGERDGRLYLVLELVEGRPFGDLLRERRLPERELLELLIKAALGMAAAHAKGIVHRDLKPANILVTPAGEPKVADFGLAHLAHAETALTRTGTTLGTPLYMAPEQVDARPKDISPATDVYALGVMLYEIATGRPPHLADTIMEIYGKILREEPVAPRSLNGRLSRDLETVVLKALEKSPARRYPDAAAFAEDLQRYLDGEPIQARPVGGAVRLWRKALKHRAVLAPAAAAVVVGLAVAAWAMALSAGKVRAAREAAARGAASEREKRFEEALEAYHRAATLDPSNAEARAGAQRAAAELERKRREHEALAIKAREQEEALRKIREEQARTPGTSFDRHLLAHWKFDEGRGTVAADSSRYGNHATLVNKPLWVLGHLDGAVGFDGVDDHLAVPAFDLGAEFTIALWALVAENAADMTTFLANADGGVAKPGFKLCVNSYLTTDRKIIFETGNGPEGQTACTAPGKFALGAWQHVAVVAGREPAAARIFLNGADVTLSSVVAPRFQANAPLVLGRMRNGNFPLRGMLDDVRIYNRKLTLPEIAELAAMKREK